MKNVDKAIEYYEFLNRYTEFFGEMESFEQHKLSVLMSGNLREMEHAMSVAQANAKQLENLENRRIALQQEAGLGGLTLRELAARAGGRRGEILARQLNQLNSYIANISFYNSKSMKIAEDNLKRFSHVTEGHTETVNYGSVHDKPQNTGPSMLETKA